MTTKTLAQQYRVLLMQDDFHSDNPEHVKALWAMREQLGEDRAIPIEDDVLTGWPPVSGVQVGYVMGLDSLPSFEPFKNSKLSWS